MKHKVSELEGVHLDVAVALADGMKVVSIGPIDSGVRIVTYGKTRRFASEGDAYEAITGRRSDVLDGKVPQ